MNFPPARRIASGVDVGLAGAGGAGGGRSWMSRAVALSAGRPTIKTRMRRAPTGFGPKHAWRKSVW